MFNKGQYELWKLHLDSPFSAVTGDSKSRWPLGKKAYFCGVDLVGQQSWMTRPFLQPPLRMFVCRVRWSGQMASPCSTRTGWWANPREARLKNASRWQTTRPSTDSGTTNPAATSRGLFAKKVNHPGGRGDFGVGHLEPLPFGHVHTWGPSTSAWAPARNGAVFRH